MVTETPIAWHDIEEYLGEAEVRETPKAVDNLSVREEDKGGDGTALLAMYALDARPTPCIRL